MRGERDQWNEEEGGMIKHASTQSRASLAKTRLPNASPDLPLSPTRRERSYTASVPMRMQNEVIRE
jgi:hypothetical protein